MYKLTSNSFKKVDIQYFISFHRWEVPTEYHEMLLELSKKGSIVNSNKEKLYYIKSKVEYGGYDVHLIAEGHKQKGTQSGTKWICQECNYNWIEEDAFVTWGDCPECASDFVQHQ